NGGSSTDHLEYVSAGWYPAWKSTEFPPSKISWDMYDMVTFAFALTTEDPSKLDLAGEDKTLTAFATEAKSRGVKSLLSVGGWTGSMYFSTHMATQKGRDTFRKAITDMVTQYKLDGIDFDWEHPNQKGACNAFAPQDTANFLSFLKDLRADPAGKDLILTAAASISPFFDANGVPSTNLAPFGEVFDYLAIMAYDIYGSWSPTTGPNAPLYSTCAGDKAVGSGESSVKAWTAAGFPIKKLLLGVAAYGRSWHVDTANAMTGNALNQYATFDATIKPLGEGEADSTVYGVDKCGEQEGPTGIWDFNGLIDAGWLMSDGEASQSHAKYLFDDCSKTPFLYNETSQTMISYDNAESFAEKGKFIYDNKLGGFAVWHILGDSSDNILLDSIHK
ncbi:glycoside hydrolase superfamily, partial [Ephemerocybe angulata]